MERSDWVRVFKIPYQSGTHFTHIDFSDSTQSTVMSGISFNEPNRKLTRLDVFNDGAGTIQIGTNLPKSDQTAEVQLNAGESYSIPYLMPVIWSMNIVVTAGAPTVRCVYLL